MDLGLGVLAGLGTILGAVNMITTVVCLRAPGMTMFRMPIFTWNILVTSLLLVLLAFPILTAALLGLEADRRLGAHVFDPANGGTILWEHLFWFFGHPEVYIVALPFFGIIAEVIPVFSRKPMFGYKGMIFATLTIGGAVGGGVGTPHVRHRRGAAAFLLVHQFPDRDPDRDQVLRLDRGAVAGGGTLVKTPMMFAIGFLLTFLLGGLTGVMLTSRAIDFHVTDTYFVVAHFHYVLYGTIVFATFAGIYFWFPKITGRMLDEPLGRIPLLGHLGRVSPDVFGAALARRRRHAPPVRRLPTQRRIHHPEHGLLDRRFVLGASTLPFCGTCSSYRYGEVVTVDDPWGYGNSLESATSYPPPPHNRTELPGSVPNDRPSNCTTRSTSNASARRHTSAVSSSPYEVAAARRQDRRHNGGDDARLR